MHKFHFKDFDYLVVQPSPDHVIIGGSVYVEGDTIKAAGDAAEVEKQIKDNDDVKVIDGKGKLLMPGLVDAHAHIGDWCSQICYNSLNFDMIEEVDQILDIYFWPAWAWYTADAAYDFTLFGLAHMLKHGTTCSSNNYLWAGPTIRALSDSGARGINHANLLTIIQRKDGKNGEEQLARIEETISEYHEPDGRVQVGVGPDTPWNVQSDILVKGMELAERHDLQYGIHIAEGFAEMEECEKLWAGKGGYMKHLLDLGLLTPRTLVWHGIAFNHEQIDILAERDVAVVHCPMRCLEFRYNTHLAYMLHKGMRVGLGTDHAPHNIFRSMYGCRLLQDATQREYHLENPWTPLELATQGGARALRLEDEIGTLDIGKKADLITYDISRESSFFPHTEATVIMGLIMQGPSGTTQDVMVDGKLLRQNGEFTELDEDDLWERTSHRINEFKDYYYDGLKQGKQMVVRNHPDYAGI